MMYVDENDVDSFWEVQKDHTECGGVKGLGVGCGGYKTRGSKVIRWSC